MRIIGNASPLVEELDQFFKDHEISFAVGKLNDIESVILLRTRQEGCQANPKRIAGA